MKIIRNFSIYSKPESYTGYVGWPTIAKMADGTSLLATEWEL